MTHYYLYFPFLGTKKYHVIRAVGMEIPRMERFCGSVRGKFGQEARRIRVSEVPQHLRVLGQDRPEAADAFLAVFFREETTDPERTVSVFPARTSPKRESAEAPDKVGDTFPQKNGKK